MYADEAGKELSRTYETLTEDYRSPANPQLSPADGHASFSVIHKVGNIGIFIFLEFENK